MGEKAFDAPGTVGRLAIPIRDFAAGRLGTVVFGGVGFSSREAGERVRGRKGKQVP